MRNVTPKTPMSNQAALPNAPASNIAGAGQDLLSQAAKRGRQALGSQGMKAVAALRRFAP